MNIEEARKVLWLKVNPRPIGELLDEGYLDKQRLEWAAQWAFNYKLKVAAKVLLDAGYPKVTTKAASLHESKPAIEIPLSLDKARSTIWPMQPHRGQPMGQLVDSKQLSLKDLGYAAENAWDEKVRQASIVLSLVRLEQVVKEPVPSAGFTQVMSGGRSFSERRQMFIALINGSIIGFLFAFLIILLGGVVVGLQSPGSNGMSFTEAVSSPVNILALVIVIGLMVLLLWGLNFVLNTLNKRLDRLIEDHRLGQEGEDAVTDLIIQALDGNWKLFRNISLPGPNKADLDLVLVGPPGVWTLEVKNFRGEYRNIGEKWEYKHGKEWRKTSVNPSLQAHKNASRLGNFLKADNLNVFVNGAVIWANRESPLEVENPFVAVWLYGRLPDELGNIWQGEKLSATDRAKINEKLAILCERERQRQAEL
jgi:hypothetical protein